MDSAATQAAAPLAPMFYVVAPRKFAILFLATLGMYPLYWFYRNWDRYKDRVPAASLPGTHVAPAVRAAFSVFFVHALFRKVRDHGSAHAACRAWATGLHATWLVVLLLAGESVDLFVDAMAGPWAAQLASLAVMMLQLFAFLKAQRMINLACDDPAGADNARLTRANWFWIALGGLAWIATLLQTFSASMSEYMP